MGYSIGIHARTTTLQQKMLDFMEKEYRPHWKIRGLQEMNCYASQPIHDPSYFHGKTAIGIDFNAAGFERGYAFTLVRWMALKVGKTRRAFKEPKINFKKAVPYMNYDGCDNWPVLLQPLSSVPKHVKWCCVDRYGLKLDVGMYDDDYIWDVPDKGGHAFNKADREACKKHGIDPDNWPKPEDEPEGILWKIHDTRNRLLWPLVKPVIAPIRVEMKRLEKAWNKRVTSDG